MSTARGARACRGSGRALSVRTRARAEATGLHTCPACHQPQPVAGTRLVPHGVR